MPKILFEETVVLPPTDIQDHIDEATRLLEQVSKKQSQIASKYIRWGIAMTTEKSGRSTVRIYAYNTKKFSLIYFLKNTIGKREILRAIIYVAILWATHHFW